MGLRPLRPRKHALAGHPASGWGWRWAECPSDMPVCPPTPEEPFGSQRVSAPSATGGSAGALSRAAVPVGPERTSPRSSSLEFRVSRAPCRALGMPGHTTPGPCACFHPCTCLASLHCPNHRGSSFRLSGAAGVLEGDQLQLRGTPCPPVIVHSPGASVPMAPGWQWSQSCHQPQLACPRSEGS